MSEAKNIRAYHTGAILQLTDWLTTLPALRYLARRTTSSLTLDYAPGQRSDIEQDIRHGALFMTNHRDIVMDSAWLSYLLRRHYNIRPYIGIGNNLFGKWWIESFVRLNRCFVVIRDGSPRALIENSRILSHYIRHLRQRGKSIWLAQREGRAKDGNDLTQVAVLKMLTLYAGTGQESIIDRISALNICPVSLSYEFDPCDRLKAREMQLKRDNPTWKKSKADDLESMQTGIEGYKGRVVFRLTPSINRWINDHRSELDALSRNEQLQAIAGQIDRQIHANYEIFTRGEAFEQYINRQLDRIALDCPDRNFLSDKLHEMYNNPVKNYEKSHFSRKL